MPARSALARKLLCMVTLALGAGAIAPRAAAADREEWRYALSAAGAVMSLEQAGGSASPTTIGGRFRWGYGLSDLVELTLVDVGFATASGASYHGAMSTDRHGMRQTGDLVGHLYVIDLSVGARLIANGTLSSSLARVHPLVGARGGVLVRVLGSPQLLDECRDNLVPGLSVDPALVPFVAGAAGVEYRFGPAVVLGLVADVAYGGSSYTAGTLNVELSWLRY
jgi:hypothetical protein